MDELKKKVNNSIYKLQSWIEKNNYRGYDPFDGLNSKLRFLTFEVPFLRQVMVQLVKRLPFNIRPLIGITPQKSSKGIAYIVRGDLLLYQLTKEEKYLERAKVFLDWLEGISCKGYSGYCWGNHFDYQTRGYFLKKDNPTLVWTALTGRAYFEAYDFSYAFRGIWTVSIGVLAILYFLLTYPITRLFGERQSKKLKELGMGGG